MDPNLFHLDWERTFEVLATVVVLAFVVERALATVFENRLVLPAIEGKGVKELITFAIALIMCRRWQFDAISTIILTSKVTLEGEILTAGVIAGGSKASVKLFRDVLGFRSSAFAEYKQLRGQGVPVPQARQQVRRGETVDPDAPAAPASPAPSQP